MKKDAKFYEDLVAEVKADFSLRASERLSLERQWELNINFLMGNQYSDIDPDGEIRDSSKEYFWQSRKVYNHIAPIVEARVSRLNKVRPKMSVRATGDEESDIKTAKIVSNILNSLCVKLDINKLVGKATDWSEITGTAFYKVFWNPEAGKKRKDANGKEYHDGEAEISIVSPFEIYPDCLTHEEISDCKSLIHARAMHVDDIYSLYGVEVEGEKINSFYCRNSKGFSYSNTDELKDYALVIERYEKPNRKFPNGRIVTVCADKVLYMGELPYINGVDGKREFPFVKQTCLPMNGSFFGISVIERIIPVQRAFNAVKNRKHEFLNRLSMGVLTVEDGAVDTDELAEDGLYPGKIIVYRQGAEPPKMMNYNSMPGDFNYEEETLKNEFTTISGVSELSRSGTTIENITSGIALQLMIEQDDNRMLFTIENVKNAIKEVAKQLIRLYKQFAVTKRIIAVAGRQKKVETFYFTKNDITSDDVTFDTENELSYTPAQKQSAVYDLLKTGLLNDDEGKIDKRTKTKLLEILGFGSVDNARDISSLHINKAEKENIGFLNKEYIAPSDIDDHGLHVSEHTAFVLSDELDDKDGTIKQMIMKHILEHKKLMAKSLKEVLND